jgi:hypothetical protein
MTSTLSKFYVYTTRPRQEFEQDVSDYINTINDIIKNHYDNIMIIIGGSYWNYDPKYDIICKNMRLSLENYVNGKNLIINIDGDIDRFNPKNNENNTYIHLKLFISYNLDCPFIIELFKFIDNYLRHGTKIYIINSVFEYGSIISSKSEIIKVFEKYQKIDNIKLLNFVTFPSTEIMTKYECALTLTHLINSYKNEFIYWKKIYTIVYGKDYKDAIKCSNLRIITFDTFLMYYFDLIFNKLG